MKKLTSEDIKIVENYYELYQTHSKELKDIIEKLKVERENALRIHLEELKNIGKKLKIERENAYTNVILCQENLLEKLLKQFVDNYFSGKFFDGNYYDFIIETNFWSFIENNNSNMDITDIIKLMNNYIKSKINNQYYI